MGNKIFKASLFMIIATVIYYFVIISFSPKKMAAPMPVPDRIAKYDVEPKGKIVITIDDAEKEAFDFLNWLIASGLGMVTYAAKKGIDVGFTVIEGKIKKKNV